jgi:hypothetical protein
MGSKDDEIENFRPTGIGKMCNVARLEIVIGQVTAEKEGGSDNCRYHAESMGPLVLLPDHGKTSENQNGADCVKRGVNCRQIGYVHFLLTSPQRSLGEVRERSMLRSWQVLTIIQMRKLITKKNIPSKKSVLKEKASFDMTVCGSMIPPELISEQSGHATALAAVMRTQSNAGTYRVFLQRLMACRWAWLPCW